ncbi:hypothetical protein [Nocardia altamirensis]|uniref:hypothetical protein n=1 Tax=Nocardia altamirensis TaxID=472158 RepID=UPI0008402C26|nr:hypothetical protein [Nocardia altamirensis]
MTGMHYDVDVETATGFATFDGGETVTVTVYALDFNTAAYHGVRSVIAAAAEANRAHRDLPAGVIAPARQTTDQCDYRVTAIRPNYKS